MSNETTFFLLPFPMFYPIQFPFLLSLSFPLYILPSLCPLLLPLVLHLSVPSSIPCSYFPSNYPILVNFHPTLNPPQTPIVFLLCLNIYPFLTPSLLRPSSLLSPFPSTSCLPILSPSPLVNRLPQPPFPLF